MAGREQGREKPRLFQANVPVFLGSAALIFAAIAFAASAPSYAATVFADVQSFIVREFGWFYVAAVATFLIFAVGVALSSMGHIRLGPDDSEPDFSTRSWFAMLFSAGMGIGIMFYGVAEPVLHFASPPVGEGGTVEAARNAMQLSFFHWGLHAWAIYAVMGLALAYFSFRQGLPLSPRSALYPLIGERIHGWPGHLVDIFAVLGTMFGVATSLGLGVMQVNAGLNYLLGIPIGIGVQVALVAGIALLATISVASGLNRGIRRLSELNLTLAVLLVVFVFAAGPTVFLLQAAMQNTGAYLSDIVGRTFTLYAYRPNDWIGGWTLFYWGWWISWSPFVGMFIARISRGRTIREFVVGVLLVPSGFTFLWFTAFGNTALSMELSGAASMVAAVEADVAVALFQFLEHLPLATVTMTMATVLIVTFFVTSSDSGSLVIDIITAGGNVEPRVWQRVFWALTQGLVAAILLLAGGLAALQTGAIAGGFPLAAIMLLICYGLFTALRQETARQRALQDTMPVALGGGHPPVPWRQRLSALLLQPTRERAVAFMRATVAPALEDVATEIRGRGMETELTVADSKVSLTVGHGGEDEFRYDVSLRGVVLPAFAMSMLEGEREGPERTWRAEVSLRDGGQGYDILGYTKDQIIADLLGQYERHLHILHMQRAG
ncbi:MAG: BCCT family transporter [Parvibaculum sp.]|nr:BCCT family transporter [Parvibaculum sp.]